MSGSKVYIKNMVCNRCIMVVGEVLRKMGLEPVSVGLGYAVLAGPPSAEAVARLGGELERLGFELVDDRRAILINKVKAAIVELVHRDNSVLKTNLSDYITGLLHHDYSYISNLFSETEGTTIEKYYIAQRIERVKELLVYDELSLSEIADMMNYSSAAHLSGQFKKITGLTPSHFRKIGENRRKPLDEV